MGIWIWAWPGSARKRAITLTGAGLAGLLVVGCAQTAANIPRGSVRSCVQVAVGAARHDAALASLPAACRGLTRSQLNTAVGAATAVLSTQMRGKRLVRTRRRVLSPLLPNMAPIVSAQRARLASQKAPSPGKSPSLALAALAAWLVTVGLGLAMMGRWVLRGGLRRKGKGPRPVMNFAHLGFALAGLAAWIAHMATGLSALAWASTILLLPVVGLGMSVLLVRAPERSPSATPGPAPQPVPVGGPDPADTTPASPAAAASGVAAAPAQQAPADSAKRSPRGSWTLILATHITLAVATMLFTLMSTVSG